MLVFTSFLLVIQIWYEHGDDTSDHTRHFSENLGQFTKTGIKEGIIFFVMFHFLEILIVFQDKTFEFSFVKINFIDKI